jgi:hypothetical protein
LSEFFEIRIRLAVLGHGPELSAERRPIWIITRRDGDALTDAIEGTGTTRTSADDPITQRHGGVSTSEKQLAVDGNLGVGTSARPLPDESVLTVREAGSWHWSSALTGSTILQLLADDGGALPAG